MLTQLFYEGDIFQMRDKSQWEVISCEFVAVCQEYLYEYKNLETGEIDAQFEAGLNRAGIVIKMADPIPQRPKCKVYNLDDYRKKKMEKLSQNG